MTNSARPRSSLTEADVRNVPVFVYALSEPDTGEIRYVGRSANPAARLTSHVATGTLLMRGWVAALAARGLQPALSILAIVKPGEDSAAAERLALGSLIARGARLLNVHGVGRGVPRARHEPKNMGAAQLCSLGMTQTDIANHLGCVQSVVCCWARGRQLPSAQWRAVLEDTFGIYWRLWDQPIEVANIAEAG